MATSLDKVTFLSKVFKNFNGLYLTQYTQNIINNIHRITQYTPLNGAQQELILHFHLEVRKYYESVPYFW